MSRATVTKLQVDVLVQAAMFGPMGATHWDPMADDADALGQSLLSRGAYVFSPLPVAVTALEVVKACQYFRYQRSRVPKIVDQLVARMIPHLDGWHDAPWGWDADDVAARLGRPGPGSELPSPPPPVLVEVAERLAAAGWKPSKVEPVVSAVLGTKTGAGAPDVFHGAISASHVELRPGQRWVSGCAVLVARSPEDAAKAFPWLVGGPTRSSEVRRVGNLLISASYAPAGFWPDPGGARDLDRLGAPDERWSAHEPALMSGPGEAVASHTGMTLTAPAVATNKRELERLLEALDDPAVQERLRGVDLRSCSVLAAPGLEVGSLTRVDLVRGATASGDPRMTEDLVVVHEPAAPAPTVLGSVVLTPRLRRRPFHVKAASKEQDRHFVWTRVMGSLRNH
jgi:hypothetical protein